MSCQSAFSLDSPSSVSVSTKNRKKMCEDACYAQHTTTLKYVYRENCQRSDTLKASGIFLPVNNFELIPMDGKTTLTLYVVTDLVLEIIKGISCIHLSAVSDYPTSYVVFICELSSSQTSYHFGSHFSPKRKYVWMWVPTGGCYKRPMWDSLSDQFSLTLHTSISTRSFILFFAKNQASHVAPSTILPGEIHFLLQIQHQ